MESIQWLELPFALVTPAEVLSAGIVLPIVCIALVGLRFYVRRLVQKSTLELDDWLAAAGVLFIAGVGACLITGERLGVMGYPTPVPSGTDDTEAYGLFLDSYTQLAKIQFALQFLLPFAYGFVKCSVILFCRRIFVGHKGSVFDWASKTVVALVILWSVGFLFGLIFGCGKSVALHWAPLQLIEASGCDVSSPEEALAISDFILDVIIMILPLPTIWSLRMSRGRKFAVTGVFLVGLVSLAASAARLAIYMVVLLQGYGAGYDINRTATTLLWWSMIEGALAAMAACLPSLSFLAKDIKFRKLFTRLGSSSNLSDSWYFWRVGTNSAKPTELTVDSLYIKPDNLSHVGSDNSHRQMVGFQKYATGDVASMA
ncbi:hypothetical protein F4779DRAFT_537908 [Xylariaceae sp. FL0662B]|nr:hypothetical protein F4779DRAFT_537908 [Xylariaceae sp. FL0662B]